MIRVLLRKIGRALITLWLVVTLTFVILRVTGDPALAILPVDSPPEVLAHFRSAWGLDRPILEQYLLYFRNIADGNLGISFIDNRDAVTVVFEKVPKTLLLGMPSLALMLAIGIPAGIAAALRRNGPLDRAIMTFAILAHSVPSFVLGILLIGIFAVKLRLLPTSGSETWGHLVLPMLTLGASGAAVIARFVRSSMLEILRQPYIRTAVAKGVPWRRTVRGHALPNAAIPIVTVIGFLVGGLVAGSVIVESVFAWPGVGRLLVTSVANRDLAVVQTILLLIAATMVTANLAIDMLYLWLDPRLRDARGSEGHGGHA
jgi:peptide/nickel transport system permease protein